MNDIANEMKIVILEWREEVWKWSPFHDFHCHATEIPQLPSPDRRLYFKFFGWQHERLELFSTLALTFPISSIPMTSFKITRREIIFC